MHFSWQAQDAANLMVSDFAKASHNLHFLVLRDAFFVAGAGRGQPYGHFSWYAQYESTNRKVGFAEKKIIYNYFLRDSNLMICNFSCGFSAKVTVRLDFRGRCSTL